MEKHEYDIIISLGGNCAVANQLKYRGMRKYSLPFDYVFMADEQPIKYLMEGFQNNFKDFCLKQNLVELKGSERGDDRNGNMQYKDTYSGFRFIHHFHEPIEKEGVYEEVKKTLDRRIERLLLKIKQNRRILFILATNFQFNVELAVQLKKILSKKFKFKKIDLLVIQFGAHKTEQIRISKGLTLINYKRGMMESDFGDISLKEWSFLNVIKLRNYMKIMDKLRYKIWKHLDKKLKKKGLI